MKSLGIIIIIIGLIIAAIGIVQTAAIHNYNVNLGAHQGMRSDLAAITIGIVGSIVVVVGWALFLSKKKKGNSRHT